MNAATTATAPFEIIKSTSRSYASGMAKFTTTDVHFRLNGETSKRRDAEFHVTVTECLVDGVVTSHARLMTVNLLVFSLDGVCGKALAFMVSQCIRAAQEWTRGERKATHRVRGT